MSPDPLAAPAGATGARRGRRDGKTIQGGATESFRFEYNVGSVQVELWTEGRNLAARVKVLQGPNSVRQVYRCREMWRGDVARRLALHCARICQIISRASQG